MAADLGNLLLQVRVDDKGVDGKLDSLDKRISALAKKLEGINRIFKLFEKGVKGAGDAADKAFNGKAVAGADKLGKKTKEAGDQAKKAELAYAKLAGKVKAVGDSISRALGTGLKIATAGIVAFTAATAVVGAGFEQRMANVQAVSGATAQELRNLTAIAREFGATTNFSATEAAEGMENLARAGIKGAGALQNTLGASLEFAGANSIGLAEATETVAAGIAQFGLEAAEATRITDAFTVAAQNSLFSASGLAIAMKEAGPAGRQFGLSLEETTALVSQFRDQGLQAEQSGVKMRNVLAQLTKVTPKAAKALANYGLSAKDVDVSVLGVTEVMTKLGEAQLSAGDALDIFGKRTAGAGVLLANSFVNGETTFESLLDSINAGAGTTAETYEIMMATLTGQFAIAKSALQELMLTIFDTFGGPAASLMGSFAELFNHISKTISDTGDVFKDRLNKQVRDFGAWVTTNKDQIADAFIGIMSTVIALSGAFVALLPILDELAIVFGAIFAAFKVSAAITALAELSAAFTAAGGAAATFGGILTVSTGGLFAVVAAIAAVTVAIGSMLVSLSKARAEAEGFASAQAAIERESAQNLDEAVRNATKLREATLAAFEAAKDAGTATEDQKKEAEALARIEDQTLARKLLNGELIEFEGRLRTVKALQAEGGDVAERAAKSGMEAVLAERDAIHEQELALKALLVEEKKRIESTGMVGKVLNGLTTSYTLQKKARAITGQELENEAAILEFIKSRKDILEDQIGVQKKRNRLFTSEALAHEQIADRTEAAAGAHKGVAAAIANRKKELEDLLTVEQKFAELTAPRSVNKIGAATVDAQAMISEVSEAARAVAEAYNSELERALRLDEIASAAATKAAEASREAAEAAAGVDVGAAASAAENADAARAAAIAAQVAAAEAATISAASQIKLANIERAASTEIQHIRADLAEKIAVIQDADSAGRIKRSEDAAKTIAQIQAGQAGDVERARTELGRKIQSIEEKSQKSLLTLARKHHKILAKFDESAADEREKIAEDLANARQRAEIDPRFKAEVKRLQSKLIKFDEDAASDRADISNQLADDKIDAEQRAAEGAKDAIDEATDAALESAGGLAKVVGQVADVIGVELGPKTANVIIGLSKAFGAVKASADAVLGAVQSVFAAVTGTEFSALFDFAAMNEEQAARLQDAIEDAKQARADLSEAQEGGDPEEIASAQKALSQAEKEEAAAGDVSGSVSDSTNSMIDGALAFAESMGETVRAVNETITARLPEIATNVAEAVGEIAQALADTLPALMAAIVDALPGLIDAIVAGIVTLIGSLGDIVAELFAGLPDIIESLIAGAFDILIALLGQLPSILTSILGSIDEIVISIIKTVASNIGPLISAIIKAIPEIIVALVMAIPEIVASLIEAFVVDFILKLPEMITAMFDEIFKFLGDVGKFIGEALLEVVTFGLAKTSLDKKGGKGKDDLTGGGIGGFISGLFGKNNKSEGTFYDGIRYVPNRMTAILDPGERVLTAQENRRFSDTGLDGLISGAGDASPSVAAGGAVEVKISLDSHLLDTVLVQPGKTPQLTHQRQAELGVFPGIG